MLQCQSMSEPMSSQHWWPFGRHSLVSVFVSKYLFHRHLCNGLAPANSWENSQKAVAVKRKRICEKYPKVCLKKILSDIFLKKIITFGESLSLRNLYCFCPSLINISDVRMIQERALRWLISWIEWLWIVDWICKLKSTLFSFLRYSKSWFFGITLRGQQQPGWLGLCKPATICEKLEIISLKCMFSL